MPGQWGANAASSSNAVIWNETLGAGTQPGANTVFIQGGYTNLYGNTTANSIIQNQMVGMFGINANVAQQYSKTNSNIIPGWNLVKIGCGPITNINIVSGGSGYTNGALLTISNTSTGYVNAVANIATTNSTGGLVSVTLIANSSLTGGKFYTTNTSYIVSSGNATLSYTFGGRAGRQQNEALVTFASMTGNTTNVIFPNLA